MAGATLEISNLGGGLGIALFGSLGAAYRCGTASTGINTQTIGDNVAQAARLSPPEATDLIRAAQSTFVADICLSTISDGVLLVIAAIPTPTAPTTFAKSRHWSGTGVVEPDQRTTGERRSQIKHRGGRGPVTPPRDQDRSQRHFGGA